MSSPLITEGQYIQKACPAIRQDYEFLTRVLELREGTAKTGDRPNIRNAPEGSQRFYGQLSKIVHAVHPAILLNFLQNWEDESQLNYGNTSSTLRQTTCLPPIQDSRLADLFEFTRSDSTLRRLVWPNEALDRATFELGRTISTFEATGITFTMPKKPDEAA